MILLVTDFGAGSPYLAQMRAVLRREAPSVPVLDLLSDAPPFDPVPAAYLLAAWWARFPPGSVILGVVDPGVGGDRRPVIVEADGRRFVGPDNGLFAVAARRARHARWWRIDWRPARLSASFHGRDLFAPVAARLALGRLPPRSPLDPATAVGCDWPDDLARIVYLDRYGNAMTGLRAERIPRGAALSVGDRTVLRARTFSDVPAGSPFWYENSDGLAEIAVNQGRADMELGLTVGSAIAVGGA